VVGANLLRRLVGQYAPSGTWGLAGAGVTLAGVLGDFPRGYC
jgi:hypothetical protein